MISASGPADRSTPAAAPAAPTAARALNDDVLLAVRDLRVEFHQRRRPPVVALDGVNLDVLRGRTLAVVGESGSGKSVTARAIMGILPPATATIAAGSIAFDGTDLVHASAEQRRRVRGPGIAMVFQDALSALNPVLPVGFQISEGARQRQGLSRSAAAALAVDLLGQVGIAQPALRAGFYPQEFSGGMRQRVMIAMALAQDPQVLIADEPTTALDVTIQAQILTLLADLQRQRTMALMLITHDMGVVATVADTIAVMYGGRVVESGPCAAVFAAPAHPYTRALLASMPRPDLRGRPLPAIDGTPPDPTRRPDGCSFRDRCPLAFEACRTDPPVRVFGDRMSRCHLTAEQVGARMAVPGG